MTDGEVIEFMETRGAEDAKRYVRFIGANKSARVAERAFMNEDFHVNHGVDKYSVDFAGEVSGKEWRVYKAVFGRTFRDLLWDIAGDRILEKEKRAELMEYYADF